MNLNKINEIAEELAKAGHSEAADILRLAGNYDFNPEFREAMQREVFAKVQEAKA